MKTKKDLYIQLWILPITENKLLNIMKPEELHTFIGLAAYINQDGQCHPSLKTLKVILGLKDISAVSKRIKHLEKLKFKGEPILSIKRLRTKNKKGLFVFSNNQYKLNPSLATIFSENGSTFVRRQQQMEEMASNREKLSKSFGF